MPRNRYMRNKRSAKNTISNVRVVDEYAGPDGVKVDRILSSMQNSHSQIRVLCSDSFTFNTATATASAYYSCNAVRNTDDFASFAAQFETYRIVSIRFDVYDVNPGNPTPVALSTWHDVIPSGSTLTVTVPGVLDAPDSQLVPPGSGKVALTWMARGTTENQFLSDAPGSTPPDFGGLRAASPAGTAGSKLYIIMKAVVDFRGRD